MHGCVFSYAESCSCLSFKVWFRDIFRPRVEGTLSMTKHMDVCFWHLMPGFPLICFSMFFLFERSYISVLTLVQSRGSAVSMLPTTMQGIIIIHRPTVWQNQGMTTSFISSFMLYIRDISWLTLMFLGDRTVLFFQWVCTLFTSWGGTVCPVISNCWRRAICW